MDWPMCVSKVEFLYVNTATSQVKFEKTFTDPFAKMMEFDLDDKLIPCSDNFDYVTKVNIASMSRGGQVGWGFLVSCPYVTRFCHLFWCHLFLKRSKLHELQLSSLPHRSMGTINYWNSQ